MENATMTQMILCVHKCYNIFLVLILQNVFHLNCKFVCMMLTLCVLNVYKSNKYTYIYNIGILSAAVHVGT